MIQLAREGCRIAAVDRDEESLERTMAGLESAKADKTAILWDMNDSSGADRAAGQARDALGAIDIVVNISGGPPPTTARDQDAADWMRYFESMIVSVIKFTDAALPDMTSRGWGRVLTSTSSGVVAPIANLGLSNSLRSSLVGWSKTLAAEIAPAGVTANIIVPGRIATSRVRRLDEASATRDGRPVDEVVKASTASIPVRRYGRPEEFAKAAAFLVSGPASYITGSVIRVDGGLIPSI